MFRTLPLREGDAKAMIAETRGAAMLGPLLRPARPRSTSRVAACLNALADFGYHNADMLDEIDLYLIKVLPEGRGCVVVDALIVARSPARG